ncbi:MAG: hypothetical protein ACYTG0_38670 [Planctomycetota bacterium]
MGDRIAMSDAAASNSTFMSLGEEFCWHARDFASMYGTEHVDTAHILLAAAEVTPVELHGYGELTTRSISGALATLRIGDAAGGTAERLPQKMTPAAATRLIWGLSED